MKPLLQLNIFVTNIERFYSNTTSGKAYNKNDYVLKIKRDISKIAAFPLYDHPRKILELKEALRKLLPDKHNPVYNIYSKELTEIFEICKGYRFNVSSFNPS